MAMLVKMQAIVVFDCQANLIFSQKFFESKVQKHDLRWGLDADREKLKYWQ